MKIPVKITQKEICKRYNINYQMFTRRHDDLMEHLGIYLDLEEVTESGKRIVYYIHCENGILPDSIPPLPRKKRDTNKTKEVEEFYAQKVKSLLPKEPELNSISKMSRDIVWDDGGGFEKYGHTGEKYVAKRYVSKPMKEYGERSEETYWTDYYTYELLTEEQLEIWMDILRKMRCPTTTKGFGEAIQNAVAKREDGKADEIINKYKLALDTMEARTHILPIKVPYWKLKDSYACDD